MNINMVGGRLARDITTFNNANGSKGIQGTVAVYNPFTPKEPDYINFKAFVKANVVGLGPYDNLSVGDYVNLIGHNATKPYTNKDGVVVYPHDFVVDRVEATESLAVRKARKEAKAAGTAPDPTADLGPADGEEAA